MKQRAGQRAGDELSPCAPRLVRVGRSLGTRGEAADRAWAQPRRMSHHELWYVWSGHGQIRRGDQPWVALEVGRLVWFQPGEVYEVRQDPADPLGVNFLCFDFPTAPRDWDVAALPLVVEDVDPALGESASRRIVSLQWEAYLADEHSRIAPQPQFTTEPESVRHDEFLPLPIGITAAARPAGRVGLLLAETLLQMLVLEYRYAAERARTAAVAGLKKQQRHMIMDVAARLQATLRQPPTVTALAQQCGYTIDHFGRVFRKVMGQSPQQFILSLRMARAKHLLTDSALSVKEIADQLGYRSPDFFSRQFRSLAGCAPSEFRVRHTATPPVQQRAADRQQ